MKKGFGKKGNEDESSLWYVYVFGHTIRVRVGSKSCKILLTMFLFDILMI